MEKGIISEKMSSEDFRKRLEKVVIVFSTSREVHFSVSADQDKQKDGDSYRVTCIWAVQESNSWEEKSLRKYADFKNFQSFGESRYICDLCDTVPVDLGSRQVLSETIQDSHR